MCVARTLIDLPTFAGSKQPTQRNDEEIPTYNDCPGRAGGGCECTDKGNAWILDRKAWLQDIHTQHPP